jgi:hypothetical protein
MVVLVAAWAFIIASVVVLVIASLEAVLDIQLMK